MTGVDVVEPGLRRDEPVELADLLVVAAEQGEEARLRAGRPLGPAELQPVAPALQLLQVHHQVVAPQAWPACRRS